MPGDSFAALQEMGEMGKTTDDPSWLIEQEGFDPSRERELESLFSLGNGYLGVRGSLEIPLPSSHADLFIAGIYDKKVTEFPYSETEFMTRDRRPELFSELVPFPSPFSLKLTLDHVEVLPEWIQPQTFQRTLNMKTATLSSKISIQDPTGRTLGLQATQCVSLAHPHLLLQEIELLSGPLAPRVQIEPHLAHPDVLLGFPHLSLFRHEHSDDTPFHLYLFETRSSTHRIAIASLMLHNRVDLFQRMIAVYTSRDIPEPDRAARRGLLEEKRGFQDLLTEHMNSWNQFWLKADIDFQGNPATTQAQRFNTYHLRIAADHDPGTSIPARGLTGRAYEGHVFWDVEVFMLPFYSHLFSEIARSCLRYRYETLAGARRRARSMGYSGACYAWESTVTGDDVTPHSLYIPRVNKEIPVFTGSQQIHISADVSFGISQYWETTSDDEFMIKFGAEILFETARFWASRVEEEKNIFHIRKVVGPDEYHHNVADNFYTNWMAKYNLNKAAKVATWLLQKNPTRHEEIFEKRRPEEPATWIEVARRIYLPKPNAQGVIEQFEGFFDLIRPKELSHLHQLKAPIDRVIHWEQVNRQQLIKQADVLMIPYLFPGVFSKDILRANYLYYEPLTDHGSSLSPPVHAAIAWEVNERADAARYWRDALNIDLLNRMHNSALGIHLACLGGCWQTLMFHFLKVNSNPSDLGKLASIIPCQEIRFKLMVRSEWMSFVFREKGALP